MVIQSIFKLLKNDSDMIYILPGIPSSFLILSIASYWDYTWFYRQHIDSSAGVLYLNYLFHSNKSTVRHTVWLISDN